ncbi:MAG: Aspartyl/glutamyl-tRNA(Asn/Gln) amidotransferase subunit B [Candidatus Woesebacteria bacterium GW2011_GWB1_43_14]|uniref:Aspartyl/glutamyl-tRNA(Asn/Gln) amidotransferase subunit B n=1 Tax=Candidatus Woesebacteria bacterium GW2011_GWB1_43_14 TaxID=1618578 RepID=A0A0G1DHS6_9BACT|nr:MAG: Aspartyl/glutamyl-tRNA(Asn/Gln) amidotransferase subunit B [Candidatus Woesebacteria bacterium GW2011_GWA1_39_11b]KKS78472.1 MAG: Aspartyl/glutamyl-tRNA(Asn/Gln) amidotransferase subunit B [Candidatus Woesebacteria bacterium GW2011_GWC1_42_9]KKS97112.1 MAG: Aspartyl/glutamyl-tRNA(Asn/Gln) amidotransferase subunit B [Candidatus Woesebacteria bacterium GW2011_GWB1_43_14]
MEYKPVIGLEVHIELSTKSKMFCSCPAEHFAKEANTQVCPICLGLPGALPYTNSEAIDSIIKLGIALGCKIPEFSKFDRKHYNYPDLPKGYQISQYDLPVCLGGQWTLDNHKKISITRVHMEEDTGKLIHRKVNGEKVTLVDFNRSGVPLVELVTDPDFESPKEVDEFLRDLRHLVRYLGISSADMEKGSLRLEANISLGRVKGREDKRVKLPDYKVELKNINSFKFLQKALSIEIKRQSEILDSGEKVNQETRGYDDYNKKTFSQRSKEGSEDYRYMPEPDIPPLIINKAAIARIKKLIPELPKEKQMRFKDSYKLPDNYVDLLVNDQDRADFFELAVKIGKAQGIDSKMIASAMLNNNLDRSSSSPADMVKKLVEVTKKDYASQAEIEKAVNKVINGNKKAVDDYKKGKTNVIGFLIGKAQGYLKGKGEVGLVRTELLKRLEKK